MHLKRREQKEVTGKRDSQIKRMGIVITNFEKSPYRYQELELVLWAWLKYFFTSKKYQFYNNTLTDTFITFNRKTMITLDTFYSLSWLSNTFCNYLFD